MGTQMTEVATDPLTGPRGPSRAGRILQWYLRLPEDELQQLVDEVDACVRSVAPAFVEQAARVPESETVTAIIEKAFEAFVSLLAEADGHDRDAATGRVDPSVTEDGSPLIGELFARVGRQMARDGVEMDTMALTLEEASSLIVGRIEVLLETHPLPAPEAVHLTSMVGSYLATLRGWVRDGFERPGGAGDVARRVRAEAFRMLSAGATTEAVELFGTRTGYAVPARVLAVCLSAPTTSAPALEAVALLPERGPYTEMLVPAHALAEVTAVVDQLPGTTTVVVGPTVVATDARSSLAVARAAQQHLDRGELPRAPVVHCDDHVVTLLLLSDHVSTTSLQERRLAPLAQIPARDRHEYHVVLYALLGSGKSVRALAKDLHYHQQTLQSRVNRLKALFGPELDEPDVRLEIMLALRHLLGPGPRG